MGLAKRIIPTLLFRGEQLVKGARFNSWRSVGHVLQAARVHAARRVDELVVLDIAATPEGRGPNLPLVEKICEAMFTPVTVGGGVRSVQDVQDLFNAGADKVAIRTCSDLIEEVAGRFGRQAIVASLDVPYPGATAWACQKALELEARGAGELLLTAIEREGTLEGYDLDMVRAVAKHLGIPVIAHGGCGTYEHMREALAAGASAVAAGAMFQFTDQTPKGAARYLAEVGTEVRL
jgi:imidazole glycerol-phosphate synthase subunit HisF